MKLKIDQFYLDRKLGYLKYKGVLEGKLLFDHYVKAYGEWMAERATFSEVIIPRLKPHLPPA